MEKPRYQRIEGGHLVQSALALKKKELFGYKAWLKPVSRTKVLRCLFCKKDSSQARSVEHIVPESLGNRTRVLPRGAICDPCNNYFASSVEAPILGHQSFQNLRAKYQVRTKKGRLPFLTGLAHNTDIQVGLRIGKSGTPEIRALKDSQRDEFERLRRLDTFGIRKNILMFPMEVAPPKKAMARLLAKMALEALFQKFASDNDLVNMLIDSDHYDRIRDFARHGDNCDDWPFHYRAYCPEETLMRHPNHSGWVQIGFGYDLLLTDHPETYFCFSYYGHEFTINVGGPSIKGYKRWLETFNGISPLVERQGLHLFYGLEGDPEQCYIASAIILGEDRP